MAMDQEVDPARRIPTEPFPFAVGLVVKEAAYVAGIVVGFAGHDGSLLTCSQSSHQRLC